MQWRKWRKIASPRRFELNAKVAPWRLAILAKIDRGLAISISISISVLITSHITFRDSRVSIFSDNFSRDSCMYVTEGSKSLTVFF